MSKGGRVKIKKRAGTEFMCVCTGGESTMGERVREGGRGCERAREKKLRRKRKRKKESVEVCCIYSPHIRMMDIAQ
jgi:hypothetical protein